ncbi:hypothetical protein K3495_g15460 [Podosphaera aphanis]|nr:hypothetical protein K3495_g15460 [Podosphaera aphanis]
MKQLNLKNIPTIICTDSYSLLMVDIMAIRESYEPRELSEIRWINGNDNPADAMTKANPTKALESLIDTNELKIRVKGWRDRDNSH